MPSDDRKQHTATIANDDEKLLAELGYKQEFQRAFTPLEACYVIIAYVNFHLISQKVFGISFSIVGLLPSIASARLILSPTTLFTIRPQLSLILLRS
jgi:hypothetical protein